MESSTVLIIALVAAAIGLVVGLLISALTGNRGDQGKAAEAGEGDGASTNSAAAGSGLSGQNKKRIEVASLWREPPMGALRVDMGGKSFSSARDLPDDQRRRLRVTLMDLDTWLSAAEPLSSVLTTQGPTSASPIRSEGRKTGPLEMPSSSPSIFGPMSTSLMESATKAAAAANPVPAAASRSIASQIDDILQEQIAGTPLEERKIRLTEVPSLGVVVRVGIQQFQGIDTVPDPEVRAAIKRAVQTWEGQAGK